MSILVDANVLSEPTRERPNPNVAAWLDQHETELFLASVTLGELQRGVSLYPVSRKRAALERWLESLVEAFDGRIVPFDDQVARVWGRFYAAQQLVGRKPTVFDSFLAATALAHNFGIATRNTNDFANAGVNVINPWSD